MAQVGWLGPKVGSHLALLCIHRVNRVNSRNDCAMIYQIVLLLSLDPETLFLLLSDFYRATLCVARS